MYVCRYVSVGGRYLPVYMSMCLCLCFCVVYACVLVSLCMCVCVHTHVSVCTQAHYGVFNEMWLSRTTASSFHKRHKELNMVEKRPIPTGRRNDSQREERHWQSVTAKDEMRIPKQQSLGKKAIATDPEQLQCESKIWPDSKQRNTSHRERKDPNPTNFIRT